MLTPFQEVTSVFLTPASILFSALGVAKTDGLKAGISIAGMSIAVVWMMAGNAPRALVAGELIAVLPALFYAAWAVSLVVHYPRHLRHKARMANARGRRRQAALVALAPAVADLFEEADVNAILMTHASLGAHALRAARLPTPADLPMTTPHPASR